VRRITVATISQFQYLYIKRNKVILAKRAEGEEIKSNYLTAGRKKTFNIFQLYSSITNIKQLKKVRCKKPQLRNPITTLPIESLKQSTDAILLNEN